MELAILILLVCSLAINIPIVMVLVRCWEVLEQQGQGVQKLSQENRRLTQELMLRLPPAPYGVNIDERLHDLNRWS